jgi:uncharacterized protein (DUF1800 family)
MIKTTTGGKRLFPTLILGSILFIESVNFSNAGTFQTESIQELESIEARIRAAQFLTRATFGPTKAGITELATEIENFGASTAFENWINDQFDESVTPKTQHHQLAIDMIKNDGFAADGMDFELGNPRTTQYRHYAWWHAAIAAEDQLRQRMAWALSQIFVINEVSAGKTSRQARELEKPDFLGVTSYYDMLVDNAFGNYRETLEDVTYHPTMGIFLSHRGNRKADPTKGTFPDENYAREVMQLMSIGLYKMKANGDFQLDKNKDPIPVYDNDDIENFARVFTGLEYAAGARYHNPMQVNDDRHDEEEKELLNGTILPAGNSTEADIDGALDNLFYHQNAAPFISRLLIQRFVKSNPSSKYIGAVSQAFENNGQGVRGDFKAVIKEILLNPEAMESLSYSIIRKNKTLSVSGSGTEHSRLQEPVLRYTAFIRAFNPEPYIRQTGELWDYFAIDSRFDELNQEPYRSPSVFNFYRPDHVPQGELQHYRPKGRFPNKTVSAPEFQLMTSVAATRLANQFLLDINDYEIDDLASLKQFEPTEEAVSYIKLEIRLDFSTETGMVADTGALVDHLNILLCQGTFSDDAHDSVSQIIEDEITTDAVKTQYTILALLSSPDCAVQE